AEHMEQYHKNKAALAWCSYGYEEGKSIFQKLETHLSRLKRTAYSAELRRHDQIIARYEKGEVSAADILSGLQAFAEQDPFDWDEFPHLKRLLRTFALEARIDNDNVLTEAGLLGRDIVDTLYATQVSRPLFERIIRAKFEQKQWNVEEIGYLSALARMGEYKQGVDEIVHELSELAIKLRLDMFPRSNYFGRLIDLSNLCDVDIRRYPNLLLYTHLLHQRAERLIADHAVDELSLAMRAVQEQLFENSQQRELARIWRAITGLHRLCRFEMSPSTSDRFVCEFGELTMTELVDEPIIKETLPPDASTRIQLAIYSIDIALEGAYTFYQLAPSRGRILAENTLRYMRDQGVTVAALVAGGFLTGQILPVLERESVSYIVVRPKTVKSKITQSEYIDRIIRGASSNPLIQKLRERIASQSITRST
ncbi:MAG: hypothetical protein ACJ8CB_13700, partial [Ktedonobacteraceae bacterium]